LPDNTETNATYGLVNSKGEPVDIYSKEGMRALADLWVKTSAQNKGMYEPTWLGIPIIQFPDDIVMFQELLWKVRPDVVVETGFAHGGSAILSSSILELIGRGRVISVEVEIRQYNRVAILSHPLSHRIEMIEGSSVDPKIIEMVKSRIGSAPKVLVTLDSNHSYDHVREELELYAPLVGEGSYLVAMDGAQALVADMPRGRVEWREDNPLRAIHDFLREHPEWEIDPYYNRMLITSNPDGFLRRRRQET
jgi:cephalosporin hydroxylase